MKNLTSKDLNEIFPKFQKHFQVLVLDLKLVSIQLSNSIKRISAININNYLNPQFRSNFTFSEPKAVP